MARFLCIIFFVLHYVVGINCCDAPTYRKRSLNDLPVSALAEPGEVMYWLKDVNKMNVDDIQRLKRYILRHGAIIIRGQNLTNEQHINFTKSIGTPVEINNSLFKTGDGFKGNITVVPVSNYWYNGTWKGPKLSYGQYWHKDLNWVSDEKAHILSILYAKDYRQGDKGGTTGFIDGCKARRDFPSSLEKHLRGVKFQYGPDLINDYQHSPQKDRDFYPNVERSVIFLHPERKCECLNMAKTKYGFMLSETKEGSLEAIEDAWTWVQNRPYYQHVYSQGDIVIWDNFAVFHKLLPYTDVGVKRVFQRTFSRQKF